MKPEDEKVMRESLRDGLQLIAKAAESGVGVCMCVSIGLEDGTAEKFHLMMDFKTGEASFDSESSSELAGQVYEALLKGHDAGKPYVDAMNAELAKLSPGEQLMRLLGMAQDLGPQEDQGLPKDQDNDVPSEFSDFLNSLLK